MVAYTTAPSDLEMGLEERTVVVVEKKSSTDWIWKVTGALLVVALCFGGVLVFAWYWTGKPELLVRRSFDRKILYFLTERGHSHVYIFNLFSSSPSYRHNQAKQKH